MLSNTDCAKRYTYIETWAKGPGDTVSVCPLISNYLNEKGVYSNIVPESSGRLVDVPELQIIGNFPNTKAKCNVGQIERAREQMTSLLTL